MLRRADRLRAEGRASEPARRTTVSDERHSFRSPLPERDAKIVMLHAAGACSAIVSSRRTTVAGARVLRASITGVETR
jgi:hypothetical protein